MMGILQLAGRKPRLEDYLDRDEIQLLHSWSGQARPDDRALCFRLEEMQDKLPKDLCEVKKDMYRGITLSQRLVEDLLRKGKIRQSGFVCTSWTSNLDLARGFAHEDNIPGVVTKRHRLEARSRCVFNLGEIARNFELPRHFRDANENEAIMWDDGTTKLHDVVWMHVTDHLSRFFSEDDMQEEYGIYPDDLPAQVEMKYGNVQNVESY